MSRKISFANGEFYHIFNRGVDKRKIFLCGEDLRRFFQSMNEFNSIKPIGSIYENSFHKDKKSELDDLIDGESRKLVNFICYCLNPNHYHFILEQSVDSGIEKFMHKLGGYSWFFNKKYNRSGSLFQGPFKAVHIDSNEQLLHTSVYVNLNDKVHQLGGGAAKLVNSSWEEYVGDDKSGFCDKGIILDQFQGKEKYEDFAKSSLLDIKERREMNLLLLE